MHKVERCEKSTLEWRAWVEQDARISLAEELRAQAHTAHRAGQLDLAERLYRSLIASYREEIDLSNFGALLRQQGRLGEALVIYRQALRCGTRDPILICNAANALRQAGELQASLDVLQQGLHHHPGHFALQQGLAKTFLAQGQPAQAIACLQPLLVAGDPSHELLFDLGVAESRLGDLEAALACFERAVQLDPAHEVTAANRITLLKELGRLEQARSALNDARALSLSCKEISAAEAGLLMAEQEMGAAALLFHQLCEQQPLDSCHWLNLAACLRALKCNSLPARVVKAGLILHPTNHELLQALLQALAELGKLQAAQTVLQEIDLSRIAQRDSHFFNLQFLATSYGLLNASEQHKLASLWEKRKQQDVHGSTCLLHDYIAEPLTNRRLRVGYLSSDFCNHPVSRFLLPILQSHDRTTVDVWGLHTGPHWDPMSEQIHQACDHWLDLRACTDLQAARMITDQRLDVLVELGGYTGNSRIGIALYGVAPIQVSYLGYPGATYLESVPGWVGDSTLFAQLSDLERRHQLFELEGGYMCFPRPEQAPEPDRRGPVSFRFASFNHARKLTDATLELWGELLHQAPEAHLVLKSISFLESEEQDRIRIRCERFGIAAEQLQILPWAQDLRDHLAQYNQVDVALDTIPYGGATTTAEALWMGVPVVTIHGMSMVGSLSASLLQSAGQSQWIAKTRNEYINISLKLLSEGIRLRDERLALCDQLVHSALNHPRRVSRQLEGLFLEAALGKGAES